MAKKEINTRELTFDIKLKSLMFGCPFGKEVSACPLAFLRKMDSRKRLEFINGLKLAEKTELLNKHDKCLHARNFLSN
jgi:hypothetical protein